MAGLKSYEIMSFGRHGYVLMNRHGYVLSCRMEKCTLSSKVTLLFSVLAANASLRSCHLASHYALVSLLYGTSQPFPIIADYLFPAFASSSHCTPTHSSTHPTSPPFTPRSAQSFSQTPKITVPHSIPSNPSSSTSSSAMA